MAKAPKEKTKVIVKTSTRMSKKGPLTPDMLRKLDAYWRAANYLAAGQLYLLDNPLLREPLRPEHLKRTLVGHWGTVPGQNFSMERFCRGGLKWPKTKITMMN